MTSLFLDTHDSFIHLILYQNDKILDAIHKESPNKHSILTMPLIEELLTRNSFSPSSLDEIYVVNGPGSFTGARIAVTITKTMAYCLDIPIKVIDSLTILAVHVEEPLKIVSIPDKNGAFVGEFTAETKVKSMFYLNKSQYELYCEQNVVYSNLSIDYEKVYQYIQTLPYLNVHKVNPLYVKGISALDGR